MFQNTDRCPVCAHVHKLGSQCIIGVVPSLQPKDELPPVVTHHEQETPATNLPYTPKHVRGRRVSSK